MSQELVQTENDQEFNKNLDSATDFGGDMKRLPAIKYDAVNGVFVRSDGEKGEDGHVIYPTDLGKEIKLHVINCAFQLATAGKKSPIYVYSKEYAGQIVELLNDQGEVVEKGRYKDLKAKYDLKYKKVLYSFIGEELVRVMVSGFGIVGWFPFLEANGNPARGITVLKNSDERWRGYEGKPPTPATKDDIELYEKDPKKLNLFYGMKFEKGEVTPQDVIIARVDEVNKYLINKNADSVLTSIPEAKQIEATYVPEDAPPITDDMIENVPII